MTIGTKSKGLYFDLQGIFDDLNLRFFDSQIKVSLRWGRKLTRQKKRSIRLGSYRPSTKSITIHPCLDQAMVPIICVERVLFHEMAHQRFPSIKSPTGKKLVHYAAFTNFEKNYPYLREADLWIKANLVKLLRY